MKTVILTILLITSSPLFAQDKVYFTNQIQTTVERADLDGGNLELLAEGMITLRRIRVDQKNEKVYWVEGSTDIIWRSDLDGGNITAFLASPVDLGVLEIDTLNNRIFFTSDLGNYTIKSVSTDGQNVQTVINNAGFVLGMDYDPVNDVLYWTDNTAGSIKKANGDGTSVTTIANTAGLPFALALDVQNQEIYYTSRQTFQIHKIDVNGTDLGAITAPASTIIGEISLDLTNERMYWVTGEPYTIKSANFDGSNENIIAISTTTFSGLDVAPTPLPINPPTSASTPSHDNTLLLFPNPGTGQLNLSINNKYKGISQLHIFDKEGKSISQQKLHKTEDQFLYQVNFLQYPSGVYLLQIQFENETITKRFVHIYEQSRP